jgi:DNA-binding PadR family transcriptional regulator
MWPFGWRMHGRRGLRMWVVSLLARAPKTGAEIMDAIEEMTQGWWRPSPGSIYPLMSALEQEGLIRKREDGRYELTEQSRRELGWTPGMPRGQPHGIEEMLNEMDGYVSYFEDLNRTDKTKLQAYRDGMRRIAERLMTLVGGGKP